MQKQPWHLQRIQMNLEPAAWHLEATSAGDHLGSRVGQGKGGQGSTTLQSTGCSQELARALVSGIEHQLAMPTRLTSIQATANANREAIVECLLLNTIVRGMGLQLLFRWVFCNAWDTERFECCSYTSKPRQIKPECNPSLSVPPLPYAQLQMSGRK